MYSFSLKFTTMPYYVLVCHKMKSTYNDIVIYGFNDTKNKNKKKSRVMNNFARHYILCVSAIH